MIINHTNTLNFYQYQLDRVKQSSYYTSTNTNTNSNITSLSPNCQYVSNFQFITKFFHSSLVYLFIYFLPNGLSTFEGYLIPKTALSKNDSITIYHTVEGIRGFIPFLRAFVRK